MSQDQFSSDEFKVRFIFVPHGDTPSDEVMDGHTDWVKVPGRLEALDGDSGARGQPARVSPAGAASGGARNAQPASPETSSSGRSSSSYWFVPSSGGWPDESAGATPMARANDPIAAYRRANEAFVAPPERGAAASPMQPPEQVHELSPDQSSPSSKPCTKSTGQDEPPRDAIWMGLEVHLPDGATIPDADVQTGVLMSPVPGLGGVAAAGRDTGTTFRMLLDNPDTTAGALPFLIECLRADLGHGGMFDYQRQGNKLTGYTQLPRFRDVSNINVGLYAQQAGLTLGETLSLAGKYAHLFSSNASAAEPCGLNAQTLEFIKRGYDIGRSGAFDRSSDH